VINEMSKVKLNDDVINASVDVAKKEQSTNQKKGWMIKDSPSVSQGTTSKAVVQPDLTYLPEISRKTECF
ncbi:hypothetical protein Tco_1205909, partial [Tanacetum coccineum]